MKFQARLYAGVDKEALEEGVNTMLKVAIDILARKKSKMDGGGEERADKQDDGQRKRCLEKKAVVLLHGRSDQTLLGSAPGSSGFLLHWWSSAFQFSWVLVDGG